MGRSALVLLALCAVATAQELKRYQDPAKVFSIDLPAAWEVRTRKGNRKSMVLKFTIKVPDVKGPVYIDFYSVDGVALTARAQARYDHPRLAESRKATESGLMLSPLPHVCLDFKDEKGAPWVTVVAFKRKLCRGLHLVLTCLRSELPKVRGAFLEAAQGAASTLGRFPVIAAGYERTEQAGFVFLSAERPPSEPPLVFLHTLHQDARSRYKHPAEARGNHWARVGARALYAVPVEELRSEGHRCLATQIHQLLFAEKYGDIYPQWLAAAGSELFAERVACGKKLPFVTQAWKTAFPSVVTRLDQLESIHETTDWDTYVYHGMAYTMLFRLGPPQYRKAFDRFLKTLRAHGDWDRALRNHLHVLDQAELMAATNKVLARKVKGVKPRR
jgi:hypothetical protein